MAPSTNLACPRMTVWKGNMIVVIALASSPSATAIVNEADAAMTPQSDAQVTYRRSAPTTAAGVVNNLRVTVRLLRRTNIATLATASMMIAR